MNTFLTLIFSCLSLVVITQNGLVAARSSTVVYTPSSGGYVDWYPVSKVFKFRILAQAFTLNLASYPVNDFPKTEIGICHPHTTNFGTIWRDNTEVVSSAIDKKYYATESAFIGYWVTWDNNNIKIGLEGETKPFLSYADLNPYPINFIGVHTISSNKAGIWIIQDN